MSELAEAIAEAIKKSQQKTGSDYTARVSRVEGNTAYVQFTGSDIADTPVSMSISCKPGDRVHVRVSDGKAWITGNDTAPPTDNAEVEKAMSDMSDYVQKMVTDRNGNYSKILQTLGKVVLEVGSKMNKDMSNRSSSITIQNGLIQFLSNTIKITSTNFTLDENGNATFGGTLNAAGGTFEGTLDFTSEETDYHTSVDDGGISVMIPASGGIPEMSTVIIPEEIYCWYGDPSSPSVIGSLFNANGVHDVSDLRLKTDIVDLSPDLAKHLRPVQFRFKIDDKTRYGFIAQDVQKVLPDAVSESKNGHLMLNYNEIIAPILALVQEQDNRITQLENRLKALEEQINGN